jgi:hypothetical protein
LKGVFCGRGFNASGPKTTRYLFLLSQFKDGGAYDKDLLPAVDTTVTLKGVSRPTAVRLLGSGKTLKYEYADNGVTVQVPADVRTKLVDVVEVNLTPVK